MRLAVAAELLLGLAQLALGDVEQLVERDVDAFVEPQLLREHARARGGTTRGPWAATSVSSSVA